MGIIEAIFQQKVPVVADGNPRSPWAVTLTANSGMPSALASRKAPS
jgi:hypothetical protein